MEYGCIGEKLGHSFSKEIHALLATYDYKIQEVPRESLDDFMTERNFRAINVTIPYKQDVIPHLYYISDEAKSIGAVNTIVNRDGLLYGYNTDFSGMRALILREGISLDGKKVLILGTGGTSRTANAVARSLNAGEIVTVSRSARPKAVTYDEIYKSHTDAQIIINTTPCGMFPKADASPVELDRLPNIEAVVDAIYNPLRTELIMKAQGKGLRATGGLYMLVHQAAVACGIFLDSTIEQSKIDAVFREIYSGKENIVLIAMPSGGKTTVGRALATSLGREFVDVDDVITEKIGMSIREYFAIHGEDGFRDVEARVIREEIAPKTGMVIATGGGSILREENIRALKRNSKIYFLDRPLDELITTDSRPLSSSRGALEELYRQRYEKYISCADVVIDGSGSIETVRDRILREREK